jgi:penicillin-binding protein 1C
MLYAGIARLGTTTPLTERATHALAQTAGHGGDRAAPTRRLMEPVAAWYVADILRGTPPPENAPGGRIAFKTGTSYGYRDAWSVGFDGKRTIGVWVGRPDGASVPGLVGRTAAAPILFDAFARSSRLPAPFPAPPHGAVIASKAKLATPLQRFRPAGALGSVADRNGEPPPHILFSPPKHRSGGAEDCRRRIAADRADQWHSPGERRSGAHALLQARRPGFARLTVIDARGQVDSVTVRLQ